ncbi:MAG: CarD family transcriptional regulator [Clostridia bacterium]|nr:CarD family transcriptional regulator [Clostridia bacterium]
MKSFDIIYEGENVFSVEEVIIYGGYSVCRILEIIPKELDGKMVDYYVLNPVFDCRAKIFVPANNPVLEKKMHRVLCEQDAYDLIQSIPQETEIWIDNPVARKERYTDIFTCRNRHEIIGLIKALRSHRALQATKKRRLHISDERFLKEAEKTMCEELAFALHISPSDVPQFIAQRLS